MAQSSWITLNGRTGPPLLVRARTSRNIDGVPHQQRSDASYGRRKAQSVGRKAGTGGAFHGVSHGSTGQRSVCPRRLAAPGGSPRKPLCCVGGISTFTTIGCVDGCCGAGCDPPRILRTVKVSKNCRIVVAPIVS